MKYSPFPIADFKTGLTLNHEPWLIPQDAFTKIENGYLRDGVLTKRLGYTKFGKISHWATQDLTGYTEVDVAANRITVTAPKVVVTALDGDEAVYDYKDFGANYFDADYEFELDLKYTAGADRPCGVWAITQDIGGYGTLVTGNKNLLLVKLSASQKLEVQSWHNGSHNGDDSAALVAATDHYLTIKVNRTAGTVTCDIYSNATRSTLVETISCDLVDSTDEYQYLYSMIGIENSVGGGAMSMEIRNLTIITYPGNPVMGIWRLYKNDSTNQLLAMDMERLNRYNATGKRFEDVSGDTWTGADYNFFWCANWNDKLYITNGVDHVKEWNGTALSDTTMDIGGGDSVSTTLLMFAYKQRLVLLRVTETTDGFKPQRARWGRVGGTDYTNDEYIDAPTEEWIVAAGMLGDDLIVFFEQSVWKLVYTANSTLPFNWVKIADTVGAYATNSVMLFSDELLALSSTGIVGTDGLEAYTVDEKIPNFVLEINPFGMKYCYDVDIDEEKQSWITYPSLGSDVADHVLCFNYQEKSWSNFIMNMHTFGFYERAEDPTWDEIDEAWDDLERSWDDRMIVAGYPITLGGNHVGLIFYINNGTTDDGNPIHFIVKGGRWNPYIKEGFSARLGYIDFLVDADPSISFDVDLYKDTNAASYKTVTIGCAGDGDKVWKRIFSGQVGSFHSIKITHTGNEQLRIHAIVPYFKSSGKLT